MNSLFMNQVTTDSPESSSTEHKLLSSSTLMANHPDAHQHAFENVFLSIYIRSSALAKIFMHLLIYNFSMLALATSLPTFVVPKVLEFSVDTPSFLALIFPLTAGVIAYISASYIFKHVNFYAGKYLILVPRVSQCTEDAYPVLSGAIIYAVSKEIFHTLGGHDAWIWILQLGACCVMESVFLILLLQLCSRLFPKFGEGMGPAVPEHLDYAGDAESLV